MATLRVRRLDANHDFTFGRGKRNYAERAEAAAQRITTRILLITGEWFLDTSDGTPWWQPDGSDVRPIMGGPRDLQYAESVLKARILGTDGIASIEAFSLSFDGTTRKMTVSCTVATVDGDLQDIQVVSP